MVDQKRLLTRLLEPLVNEWGYEEVARALSLITNKSGAPLSLGKKRDAFRVHSSSVELVKQAQYPEDKKVVLKMLADRFDRKDFLPGAGDIREFLFMLGEHPKPTKDRKDAFRTILPKLATLPLDRLEEMARSSIHSGPSQLGPLSDAIAGIGETLVRPQRSTTIETTDLPELPNLDEDLGSNRGNAK